MGLAGVVVEWGGISVPGLLSSGVTFLSSDSKGSDEFGSHVCLQLVSVIKGQNLSQLKQCTEAPMDLERHG